MIVYHRSVAEVVAGASLIFPFQGICPEYDEPRNTAIIEVLRRIPESDFQQLEEAADRFVWFIPKYDALAAVMPFHSTHPEEHIEGSNLSVSPYSRVLYLSPLIADVDLDVAVAAVSHELAHIVLNHEIDCPSEEEYKSQEDEAWELVGRWGFTQEAKAHEKYCNERE